MGESISAPRHRPRDLRRADVGSKIGELGEYHPYVQAILEGDPRQRDLALMAVYDLVRTSSMSTRKVRSDEREEQIQQEAELRRQAAGVVTGGPTPSRRRRSSPRSWPRWRRSGRQRGQWRPSE